MKRDKVDAAFSTFIRKRDKWTCTKCGKYYPEGMRQGLHCSHIFSRRHKALRFDPANAVAHCYSCHQWYGGNPIEGGDWAKEYLGEETVNYLIEKKQKPYKMSPQEKEEIYENLKRMARELDD